MVEAAGRMSMAQTPEEMAQNAREVSFYNKTLNNGKELKKIMGQEDFLNLLITELKYQDPTAPMKDREFIAQMASFSSLEQMKTLNDGMEGVSRLMARTQAYSLLGKSVEITDGKQSVHGLVQEVTGGDAPQVLVNGTYYDFGEIKRVMNEEKGE
jgi:flagellar basal-body rod modification protein FlgD